MNFKSIKKSIATNLLVLIENKKNSKFKEVYIKLLNDLLKD